VKTAATGSEFAVSSGHLRSRRSSVRSSAAFISKERRQDLEELQALLESGAIRPVVDKTFSLTEVPEAISYLREGSARGKIAITV